MLKKTILGTVLFLAFVFVIGQSTAYSQTLSPAEQKLMKDQMKDSLNSANYISRQAKLNDLLSKPPTTCNLESIDGLSTNSKVMIEEQNKTNELLKTYVGKLTSEGDGQTVQQDGNKVTLEDVVKLLSSVGNQTLAIADASLKVTAAAGDIAKLSPMKIGAGKKSLNYTKDALAGLGTQLKSQASILEQMKVYKQATKNL